MRARTGSLAGGITGGNVSSNTTMPMRTAMSAPAKDMEVYRFNNHEGGQEHHWIKQLQFLRKLLSS